MDLQAALAELSASCRLAAQVPAGEKLLRAAARRLAATAESMGEAQLAGDALRIAEDDDAFDSLLEQALALAAGESPTLPEPESIEPDSIDTEPIDSESTDSYTARDVEPESTDEDDEMVEMLAQSMTDASSRAEELLLQLESEPADENLVAEIRRVVHTVKGEAGVLGLDAAQVLCHEAEEMVDRCVDTSQVPALVDPLLGVVDWLSRYADDLRQLGAHCSAPPSDDLRERINGAPDHVDGSSGAETGAATVAEDAASSAATTEATIGASPLGAEAAAATNAPLGGDLDCTDPVDLVPDASMDDTLQDFIDESRHHLEDIEADLLEFESRPDDSELLNRIFRTFHTIKGVAGFMNLKPIVELTHVTETLLDRLRQETLEFHTSHVDLVLNAADLTSKMVDALTGAETPQVGQLKRLERQLELALEGHQARIGENLAPKVKDTIVALGLDTLQGQNDGLAKPMRLGERLVEAGIVEAGRIDEILAIQADRASQGISLRLGDLLVELGVASREDVESALSERRGAAPAARALEAPVEVESEVDGEPAPGSSADSQDAASEVPIAPEVPAPASGRSASEPTPPNAAAPKANPGKRRPQTDAKIKVSTVRLDALVDMVGELVIAQQMVLQDPDVRATNSPVLNRNLGQIFKITRDLQEASMSLRMVTFRSTFQKVTRLVRDVAQKAGKSVDFVVTGADTEVDRNVVERISDPLVHLVRNAIDHGLETPEGRKAAGKDSLGRLELRAYHASGSIVVEVKEDGRGLNRDVILDKALERGLLPASTVREDVPDEEVFKLIFEPGFSTAAAVTDISGRGVGMDVVRKNIEAMRGRIEIISKLGEGTTFQLWLPLTLAIIDGMVVRVGDQRYVLPTLAIEESFQPSAREVHWSHDGGPIVNVRGALLSLRQLSQLINGVPSDHAEGVIVLLNTGSERFCLQVDEIVGQQQVVIKNLGTNMPKIPGVAGGAIMGDGRVALIIDVEGLVREGHTLGCY